MPSRVQSRREFIAASTAGILAMTVSSGEFPADSVLFYVGTYTDGTRSEGIYLVRMNTRTGELELLSVTDAGPNPSFLAVHPSGRALYAANEATDGGVSAFAISEGSGALTRINRQPSGGSGPCFVSVDRTSIARDSGGGPNAERQEAPHAHCILAEPSNRFALAADLGADRVFVYELDIESGSLRHREDGGDAVMRAGAGPRHIAFHPTEPLVFVSCELDSTVATLRFDVIGGTLTLVATTTTLPQGWKGENYPADIHVAPSGNALYVSNRGHDSIAVFSIGPAGALRREQHVSTEGSWPRNFSLDPSGRWLLVANQKSSSIVLFARDEASGRLTRSRGRLEVPSPACIRFRASAPG
jgi:6-phosphogluconolactonase